MSVPVVYNLSSDFEGYYHEVPWLYFEDEA